MLIGFKHDLIHLQNRFKVEDLTSSDSIKKWNEGKIQIAAIHPASGIWFKFTSGGSTLVWFGLTWSLELYQQTNAGCTEQGQTDTVIIHHLIAKETMDERVMDALNKKNNTQSALIDAVKATLKRGNSCMILYGTT